MKTMRGRPASLCSRYKLALPPSTIQQTLYSSAEAKRSTLSHEPPYPGSRTPRTIRKQPHPVFITELDTCATFCEVAKSSNEPVKTKRNVGNARKAYDTILKFQQGVLLDNRQKSEFEGKFSHLKSLLKELGEDV